MKKYHIAMPMKMWAVEEQPIHKIVDKGSASLSDAELLSLLIRPTSTEKNALEIAREILFYADNKLQNCSKISIAEFCKFEGIGSKHAAALVSIFEIGRRMRYESPNNLEKITSSSSVFSLMRPIIGSLGHEEFWVLFLNNSNKVISKAQLSKGGITGTVVDLRILFKNAIGHSATGIILCHNHPSGALSPSNADRDITKKIRIAGEQLDIKLLDHLIITEEHYYSFADEGIL